MLMFGCICENIENIINRRILDSRLKECGLYKFERAVYDLCKYWFEDKSVNDEIKILGHYIFSSGIFGTYEQYLATKLGKKSDTEAETHKGRMTEYLSLIFLPLEQMKLIYPILRKNSLLLPAAWIYRIVTAVVFKRNKISEIKENYDSIDAQEAKKIFEFEKKSWNRRVI